MGFLIEVPTSFSSIEKLAKKWQMAHTERHPPKEIGRARPIFFYFFEFYNPGSGINIHYLIVNLLSFPLVILLNGSLN